MALEHGQDRAHKGHLSESLRNAIGDEISWLEGLWIKVEFERAFLTRLTYAFQGALRMLVSSTLTHVTTDTAFSHALGTMPAMGMAGGRRLTLQNRAKQIPQFVKMPLGRVTLVNRQIRHRPTVQRAGPDFGAIIDVRRIECRLHARFLLG